MSETPVPRDPGQDDDLAGVLAGPGDRPRLGSPGWRLVPQRRDPRWKVEQLPDGNIRWTTPSGRQYVTEPTRYPI